MTCHSCTHGRRSGSRLQAVCRTEVRVSGRLGQLIAAELPYRALQPNRSVESTDWIRNDAKLAFGVANAVQVAHTDTRFRDGILNDFESPLSMVYGCVARKEPFAGRCDVGMPDV